MQNSGWNETTTETRRDEAYTSERRPQAGTAAGYSFAATFSVMHAARTFESFESDIRVCRAAAVEKEIGGRKTIGV